MAEITTVEPNSGAVMDAPADSSAALMALIQRAATDKDFSVEKLEKLLDVKERWDAEEARRAYVGALAKFKRAAPALVKNKQVDFTPKTGGRVRYKHATLGQVAALVAGALAEHGLSHGWGITQNDGDVTVTCTLTHERGHSESVSLTAPPDDTGGKNVIQRIGSTATYLQRYTLLAITGLASDEQDDDGIGAGERGQARTSAAPPKPAPAQPPTDPDTGKLLPPSLIKVAETPNCAGADWMAWGSALAAALNAAGTADEVDAWLSENDAGLRNCERDAPRIHERIMAVADRRRGELEPQRGAAQGDPQIITAAG